MRAARTPPEPAPMTNKSTSLSAIARYRPVMKTAAWRLNKRGSKRMPSFLQLFAHLRNHFVGQGVRPILRESQAGVGNFRLFGEHFFAQRRFIEREQVLEFLLGKTRRIEARYLIAEFVEARRQIGAHLLGDLVEDFAQVRVLLKQQKFCLLDDACDQWREQRSGTRGVYDVFGGR